MTLLSRMGQNIELAWSDAARAAALEARREAMSTRGMKPEEVSARNKLDADTDKAEAEHLAQLKGEANYGRLSHAEKAQYNEDWNNAQKATATAKSAPSVANHEAAAVAHTKAANSAPVGKIQDQHVRQANLHQNLANAFKPRGVGVGEMKQAILKSMLRKSRQRR